MTDWGRTFEEILDGMSLPQFRLLAKMRERRTAQSRRWDLVVASMSVQTQAQLDAVNDLMEQYELLADGDEPVAHMGGGFTASKRYPLLHEIQPTTARMMRLPIRYVTKAE